MTTAIAATPTAARKNGRVSQVTAADIDDVSQFLQEQFHAPDAPFASVKALRWKYVEPDRAGMTEAAFTLGARGRIVAHAGWRAAAFGKAGETQITCGTIIDWAADPGAPGAGVALYRHLMGQATASYLIGGTPTTQAIAERLGFRTTMRVRVYSRWLHPLHEFMQRPKTPRSALRLLHGAAHAPLDRLARTTGWRLVRVPSFDHSLQVILSSRPAGDPAATRSVSALNHRLRNPDAVTRGYMLLRNEKIVACALVAVGSWNARILGVYGCIESQEDRAAAYSLLTAELSKDPDACRVSVLASIGSQQDALTENGFWVNRVEPVSFYDPSGRAASLGHINFQYFDADLDDYNS